MRAGRSSPKNQLRVGEALLDIKNPTDKTLQTIVGAADTIFYAAAIAVSDAMKIIYANENIFRTSATIFLVAQKMFSRFATIFRISQTKASDTRTKVEGSEKRFCVAPIIF